MTLTHKRHPNAWSAAQSTSQIEKGTSQNSSAADSSHNNEDENAEGSDGSDSEDGGVVNLFEAQERDELGGDSLSEITNGFDKSLYVTTENEVRLDQLVPFQTQARSVTTTHIQTL